MQRHPPSKPQNLTQGLWQRQHRGRRHAAMPRCASHAARSSAMLGPERRRQVHPAHRHRPDQSAHLRPRSPSTAQLVLDGPRALVDLRAFRRQHLGFVFQKANLIPFLTARGERAGRARNQRHRPRAARRRAWNCSTTSAWPTGPTTCPTTLSGGQQQRVAVARRWPTDPAHPRRRTHGRPRQPARPPGHGAFRKVAHERAPPSSSSPTITARSMSSTASTKWKTA